MIKLQSILKTVVVSSLLLVGAISCESIYDHEPDCSTKIKLVFKKHRQALHSQPGKAADVFDSTVGSVHVFIYDAETGELVAEKIERTENLKSAADLKIGTETYKCYLEVDIPEGDYKILAWCGLDENDHNNAFSLEAAETRSGDYSHCGVKIDPNSGHPVHAEKYDAVYHGVNHKAQVTGNNIVSVELTKNTNDIAVYVQHANMTFSDGDYEVVYTDANGSMKFEDNSIHKDDRLEYHPHSTSMLETSTEYNGALVESGAMVAHISTSRLMEANRNDARLEVRNKEGQTVFSIPFIKYVLQMQTLTDDSQYYLDCEDTYNCSFYLTGENGLWMPARIIINNWVKVPDQTEEI